MKKIISAMLAIMIVASGCTTDKPEPEKVESTITENSPKEEIIENNKGITEDDVKLIQFEEPKSGDMIVTFETNLGDISVVLFPEEAPEATSDFLEHVKAGTYNGAHFNKIMENFYIEASAEIMAAETESDAEAEQPAESAESKTEKSASAVSDDSLVEPSVESSADESKDAGAGEDSTQTDKIVGVESSINLWSFRGALVMAENPIDNPGTDMSKFFIVQASLLPDDIFVQMEEIAYPAKVITKYKQIGGIPGFDGRYTVFGQVISGMEIVDEIAVSEINADYTPKKQVVIKKATYQAYDPLNKPGAESSAESGTEMSASTSSEQSS